MDYRKVTVNVTNRTIVRAILWVAAAIIIFKFIGKVSHELILILISFFLALALNPVVSWISRHLKVRSRGLATTVAYLMVIIILAAFFALVTPPLVRQTRTFISDVPQTIQNFQNQNSPIARSARRYHIDAKITKGAKDFASQYSNVGSTVLNTGRRIVEALVSLLVVIVLTFMMLVEGPRWLELFWGIVPAKNRTHHKQIAYKMYRGVTGFVNGQVILAIIAGIFAFMALEIASRAVGAHINAVALAGIVSVFGLIPLFGNPSAAIVVILACLINSAVLGLIMLIYFIIYFFIENHTFQPYIQSRLNELSALTVFVAAIIGVGFAGFLGAIVAIPVASAIKILVEDYFERRRHRPAPTQDIPGVS